MPPPRGCNKQPSYGVDGSYNRVEFCSEHKRDGMVNVGGKRCLQHSCNTVPSYSMNGSKKRELCSEHQRDGMVNVVGKKCNRLGCSK